MDAAVAGQATYRRLWSCGEGWIPDVVISHVGRQWLYLSDAFPEARRIDGGVVL